MTQKQIEQTRVIAKYDGWELRGEPQFIQPYKIWIKQLPAGTKMIPYISLSGKEYDGWYNDMKDLTSLDWLHKVAMDVMEELEAMLIIPALQETIKIRSKCAYCPINGEYIDLFNAVYDSVVFLNENKTANT